METPAYPNQPQGEDTQELKEFQDEMNFLQKVSFDTYIAACKGVIESGDYERVQQGINLQKATFEALYLDQSNITEEV